MRKTIELFIGSNNTTHKVERDKLEQVLSKYHEGFTIQPAVGYWLGAREDSVTVIISDDFDAIINTIQRLKQVLKQDAIAYHEVTPLEFL
jgi:hypothetical protein